MSERWAVFLDRDGVLVADREGFVTRPEQVELLPGAGPSLKRLKAAGALLVVVTNQPAVARGLIDEIGLALIHKRLEELLAAEGATLDALYYCPHHPETQHPEARDPKYRRECDCRKPKPGMLQEAAARFGIALKRSFLIGDTTRDMQTAHNAGCRAVLVRTGEGGRDGRFPQARPDIVVDDLEQAADWILENA